MGCRDQLATLDVAPPPCALRIDRTPRWSFAADRRFQQTSAHGLHVAAGRCDTSIDAAHLRSAGVAVGTTYDPAASD
jgi:hypothetical protein